MSPPAAALPSPLRHRSRVRLGSLNAAKLEAVRRGLEPFVHALVVSGHAVESGVSAQPLGFDEIVLGARQRARRAFDREACDLSVGIEDGLVPLSGAATGWVNVGCCAIYDGQRESLGLSAGFEYPPVCVRDAVEGRAPIGDAFERVFAPPEGWPEPLRGAGNVGRLTGGALSRVDYGAQAVICAAVRWLHPDLYEGR